MYLDRICVALALCSLTATACAPVDDTAPEETLVSRAFDLTDATGENSVTVVISAEYEEALADIDPASLILTIGGRGGIEALAVGAIEAIDEYKPRIQVEVIDEQLAEGVDTIDIVETAAPAWRAPFIWRYSYSNLDCVDVQRTSFWHAVYVSIWSKAEVDSDWDSMVTGRKLSNGETLSRCDEGSYQLKVGVEARERDDYSIEFND